MGKRILLAAVVIIALVVLLARTGQLQGVIDSISPWAKKGSDAVSSSVHTAAPGLPTALPTSVSEGQQKVNDALNGAGLGKSKADAKTPSTAVGVLDSIDETTDAPAKPYKRAEFGAAWTDSTDGCSVRDVALTRNVTDVTYSDEPTNCVVASGSLHDPYTGQKTAYTAAGTRRVTLDAVVPLSWAWANGADAWTAAKRAQFAADQTNITVTTAGATSGKNGAGPAGWMPGDADYRCTYITRFIYTVHQYGLTMNASDKAVIRRDLTLC